MCYTARIVYQKKDLDERVKVVVLFLVWEWRCDGGGRPKGAVARV